MDNISSLAKRILGNEGISFEDAKELLSSNTVDPYALFGQANQIRAHYFGRKVHLCSIANAKMGGCSEDCSFCSQAAQYNTDVPKQDIMSKEEMIKASRQASLQGASGLGLVTATRGMKQGKEFQKILEGVRAISEEGKIEAHASLGFLGKKELLALKEAGLTEINHNLETGRGYFDKICSTHTYEERIDTIKAAKEVGLKTCVGGIFGMGESPLHRAQLAFTLKELDVDEVPLNFLVQVDGTPLATSEVSSLTPLEMLTIISVFRFVLPEKNIFVCAGRKHLGDLQSLIFFAGASGIMIGDFLTTVNRSVEDDLKMLSDLGFEGTTCGKPIPTKSSLPSSASPAAFGA